MTWVIATDGTDEDKTAAREFLLEYFSLQGMTAGRLEMIVGTGSMLSMIIAPIRYNILHDPAFGWCPTDESINPACDFRTTELRRDHLE